MTTSQHEPFKVDRALRINIAAAILLIVLCPLALWQFYFKNEHTSRSKNPDYTTLLRNYCATFNRPAFHAGDVFAPTVKTYLDTTNVTPTQIDHLVAIKRQTEMFPRATLLLDSIYIYDMRDGEQIVNTWIREVHYMKLQMQYQQIDRHYAFTYNAAQKIVALELLDERYEIFSKSMP